MCEISEKIFSEGREEGRAKGELKKAKETALRLADLGFTAEKIAEIVQVSVNLVRQWIDSRAVTVQ